MLLHSRTLHRLLYCSAMASSGIVLAACGGSSNGSATAVQAAATKETKHRHGVPAKAKPAKLKCARTTAPTPKGAQRIPKPKLTLDPAKHYVVNLKTNCGMIAIQLAVQAAPRTTASFAYLVQRGFYDNLTFHRVATGFVIQGGDPNGDGSGGPGYTIVEPPPSHVHYTLGTVAMAKTGTDPAGASGSQFFIVTTREAPLPAQYALVGNVVGSLAGVEAIAKLPTDPPGDGSPKTPVVIDSATLSSS